MVTAGNRLVIHSFEHREATLLDSLAHRGSPLTTVTQSFSSSANTSSHPLLALIDNVDITAVDFEKAYFASIASVPLCMDTVTPLVEAIIRRSFSTVASASPSAFWPRRVIDHLLRTFALSARHGNIMRTLLCRGDLPLLNTAVCHVQDFNEREIVAAMRFVMSGVQVEDLERDLAARQAELLGASVNDTTVDVFRFPFLDRQAVNATTLTGKMQTPAAAESATDYWLRLLIAYPCSDAMMVRALKSLTVVELGMVLSFIRRWFQWNHMTGTNVIRGQFQRLKQMIPAGTELPHKPLSIAQLVTFVGHLVDAHLSTIILTAALHETFLAVVEHARFEVRLCDETALLHNVLRDVYHVGDGANNGTETKGAAKKDSAGVPERKHTDRRAFITSKSSAADREANRSIGAYAMERTQWW